MNILTKEELVKNCNDNNMIQSFLKEKEYLENLGDCYYQELSKEDKVKIDILIDDIDFVITTLATLITKNKYLKTHVKIMNKFLGIKNKRIISSYYDMLYNYVENADQICEVINNKEKRTISEIKKAYVLSFLSFITYVNDTNEMDFRCYNFKKYSDSDILDFSQTKSTIKMYEISLKNCNRQFKEKKRNNPLF